MQLHVIVADAECKLVTIVSGAAGVQKTLQWATPKVHYWRGWFADLQCDFMMYTQRAQIVNRL